MLRIAALLSLIIIAVMTASPPVVAGMKMSARQIYEFRERMNQLILADQQLYEQMRYTANRFNRYYAKFGHLPNPGVQQDNFKRSILSHFNFNPYHPKVVESTYDAPLPEEAKSHLTISQEPMLTLETIRSYKKAPPQDWKAEPGSIFVITNGENIYVIWGAGADRTPISDIENGTGLRIIYRDLVKNPPKLTR